MLKYFLVGLLSMALLAPLAKAQSKTFLADSSGQAVPWTQRPFQNNPNHFQFAVVTDRTGGHRDGVFEKAVEKLNLLHPEFVMSVGDLIEGYTKDRQEIAGMWQEWDSILAKLNVRFFAVPGNHDISNEVMREVWQERYGHAYYHFVYKNVLFLAMDTNEEDGQTINQAQIDYVKKALNENPNVRWTLLFMHHPIWNYREFNGFNEIERALQDRNYTVLAGHNHTYLKASRNSRNYYILATTGGGSNLRGPRFQEFDHVTWITMTDQGPELVNLALSGIINDDVVDAEGLAKARNMLNAIKFEQQSLRGNGEKAQARIALSNIGKDTLFFKGRMYHHHQVTVEQSQFNVAIPPLSSQELVIDYQANGRRRLDLIDPLELDWSLALKSPEFEPPYLLEGTLAIPAVFAVKHLFSTAQTIFLQQHTVGMSAPFTGLNLHYTLDGSEPTPASPRYVAPFQISATTTVKARFFSKDGQAQSETWEKTYTKTVPANPVVVKGAKPGLKYRYYEGTFNQLPNFSTLQPTRSGVATDWDVAKIAEPRIDHYAVVYEGYLEIPADGLYTLYTYSDDGSKLFLHNQLVVDNDGSHSAAAKRGDVALKKGFHPIRVEYFEDFLGQELQIGLLDGNGQRQPITFKQLWQR